MTSSELIAWLKEQGGYLELRELPDGTVAGLIPLIYTTGLCLGLTEIGWTFRFCYESRKEAQKALANLESVNDEPKGWIARR